MITAQDIREKTFEKSRFNGYAMDEVDDFLDELANDLAASQKETSVLKGKMKVLVDKIEEYRSSEDAMHMALVTAQKVAKDLETEARTKAEAILAEAQDKAEAILAEANETAASLTGNLEARRREEELRLQKAKAAASEYIQTILLLTEREKDYISSLKEADLSGAIVTPAPAEKKAIAAPVQETEEAFSDTEVREDETPAPPQNVLPKEPPAEEFPDFSEEEPDFFSPVRKPEKKASPAPRRSRAPRNEEPDYFKDFEDAVFGSDDGGETLPAEEDDSPMFRF